MTIWVGTEKGVYRAGEEQPVVDGRVTDLVTTAGSSWLALVDGRLQGDGGLRLDLPGPDPTCLIDEDGAFLVGTAEAHLLRVSGDGTAVDPVASFDQAEGRDRWYTPWGGPPDTRSLSRSPDGTVYVNVHVGGILRGSLDGPWLPTIDVDADVHQVLARERGLVEAATAYGLARSTDGGGTWTFETEGLDADYSRAVALAGEWLLLSASIGPRGERAGVYRRPLDAAPDAPFERLRRGLPEWFSGNIDTHCLVARGDWAALGTGDGSLYVSEDAGASWELVTDNLPRVTALALAS
jgi:hypothetical protein